MKRILFITALQAESKPIVDFYGLKKTNLSSKIFYYNKNNIYCLRTGVGKKNVIKRLKPFLQKFQNRNECILLNIGIAGGSPNQTEIGSLYIVNKIIDEENKKIIFLNNASNMEISQLPLTTVNAGITHGSGNYEGLVDMEASTIYDESIQFLPQNNLYFLKVVSDHMEHVPDSPEQVIPLIYNIIPQIESYVQKWIKT